MLNFVFQSCPNFYLFWLLLLFLWTRYSADYGMFHFCVAASEEDWREGTEQWNFLDQCLGSVDRSKQPWLIFLAHRVLGYSTGSEYQVIGSFGEPMGHDSLQKLWQLHKVDLAFYGHVHTYERTCPIYEVRNYAPECFYTQNYNPKPSLMGGSLLIFPPFLNLPCTWFM